jgi:hypothetical protein
MYGNVWELCEDFWHPNYDNAPSDGSVWEGGDQSYRVVRGGGAEDLPNFLRSASRSMLNYDSKRQLHRIGFRLVRSGGFLDQNLTSHTTDLNVFSSCGLTNKNIRHAYIYNKDNKDKSTIVSN